MKIIETPTQFIRYDEAFAQLENITIHEIEPSHDWYKHYSLEIPEKYFRLRTVGEWHNTCGFYLIFFGLEFKISDIPSDEPFEDRIMNILNDLKKPDYKNRIIKRLRHFQTKETNLGRKLNSHSTRVDDLHRVIKIVETLENEINELKEKLIAQEGAE